MFSRAVMINVNCGCEPCIWTLVIVNTSLWGCRQQVYILTIGKVEWDRRIKRYHTL